MNDEEIINLQEVYEICDSLLSPDLDDLEDSHRLWWTLDTLATLYRRVVVALAANLEEQGGERNVTDDERRVETGTQTTTQ